MTNYGTGECANGYGWGDDGLGEASEEDCKNQCMKEDPCKFSVYVNINYREGDRGGNWVTTRYCKRFLESTCNLQTSNNVQQASKTFAKKGLFNFLHEKV